MNGPNEKQEDLRLLLLLTPLTHRDCDSHDVLVDSQWVHHIREGESGIRRRRQCQFPEGVSKSQATNSGS